MGFGGISIWQLLIVLAIVVLLFGTKKLRNIGGDLGSAIKNFKQSMKEGEAEADKDEGVPVERQLGEKEGRVFDSEVEHKDKKEA